MKSSTAVSGGRPHDANNNGKNDDSYPRWQEHSRGQLEFINNLLIGLSAGLIVIALTAAGHPIKGTAVPIWQRTASGIAVILVGLSALTGVILAANRLQSTRLTARRVRIRNLRDEVFPIGGGSGPEWRRERLMGNLKTLDAFEHWSRPGIRRAARKCIEPGATLSKSAVTEVVKQLRDWTWRADKRSWLLVRVQQSLFVVGAMLFLTVPVWNLFHAT